MDKAAERGVDGGQDLGQLLHLDDRQAAGDQRVGHLQADVARADDDHGGRLGLLKGAHDGEGVAHRVEQVHAVSGAESAGSGQAGDRRADREGTGADDQLVVGEQFLAAAGGGDQQLAGGGVDPACGGVQPQAHPGSFQVGDGAVGQVAPVGHLPGDVVGDAADREVRVGIRDHHADLGGGIQLAGPQRGADPGVTAADHDQVHANSRFSWVVSVRLAVVG